jgi:hypothetical protein
LAEIHLQDGESLDPPKKAPGKKKGKIILPTKKESAEKPEHSMLVSAAKAIGTAAGKVAKLAGVAPEAAAPAKSQKIPKLTKKSKNKLPRRDKKTAQKSSK